MDHFTLHVQSFKFSALSRKTKTSDNHQQETPILGCIWEGILCQVQTKLLALLLAGPETAGKVTQVSHPDLPNLSVTAEWSHRPAMEYSTSSENEG